MRTKTKKIIIIAVAVVAVAAIIYFAFFRNGKKAKSIIDGLNVTDEVKTDLLNQLAIVETWPKETLEEKAKEKGRGYEQQLVAEAAFALYSAGTLTYDQMQAIVAQL